MRREIQPMTSILFDYYFTLLEVFVLLSLFGGIGIAVLWGMRRSWRNEPKTPEAVVDQNQSDFLHSDLVSGLDYISNRSAETLNGLGEEQIALREQQDLIINKAGELIQSAENVLDASKSEGDKSKELCNIKQLVQSVLKELFRYAQSRGVTLRPNLDDVEPIVLYKYSTLRVLKNVIHNAIKYSHQGGVVEITLSLERGEMEGAGKVICVMSSLTK